MLIFKIFVYIAQKLLQIRFSKLFNPTVNVCPSNKSWKTIYYHISSQKNAANTLYRT